jgi:hypothetical protein
LLLPDIPNPLPYFCLGPPHLQLAPGYRASESQGGVVPSSVPQRLACALRRRE